MDVLQVAPFPQRSVTEPSAPFSKQPVPVGQTPSPVAQGEAAGGVHGVEGSHWSCAAQTQGSVPPPALPAQLVVTTARAPPGN